MPHTICFCWATHSRYRLIAIGPAYQCSPIQFHQVIWVTLTFNVQLWCTIFLQQTVDPILRQPGLNLSLSTCTFVIRKVAQCLLKQHNYNEQYSAITHDMRTSCFFFCSNFLRCFSRDFLFFSFNFFISASFSCFKDSAVGNCNIRQLRACAEFQPTESDSREKDR